MHLEARRVCLLYSGYFLRGNLMMVPKARFSDFIAGSKPFHALHNVELGVPVQGKPLMEVEALETYPFATVNFRRAGGMFDVTEYVYTASRGRLSPRELRFSLADSGSGRRLSKGTCSLEA